MPSALEALAVEASSCTRCVLAETRTQVVFGVGDPHAGLMVIGEGPGAQEDEQGEPFVGRSGQLFDRLLLEETGMRRGHDVYITNVVRCRPPGNRDPLPDEIEACRPWLEATVDTVDPRVIMTLGNFSSKLLLGTKVGITRLRGRSYPYGGRVLVPTLHPAAVLRGGGGPMAQMRADLVRAKLALTDPTPSDPHPPA